MTDEGHEPRLARSSATATFPSMSAGRQPPLDVDWQHTRAMHP